MGLQHVTVRGVTVYLAVVIALVANPGATAMAVTIADAIVANVNSKVAVDATFRI